MFLSRMSPRLRPTFEPYILSQINHIPLSHRLPSYFTPGRLLAHLLQFASHRGLSHLLTDPPHPPSSGPTSLPSPALVHALGTAACDFCEAPGHLASACPRLTAIASDPRRRRRLTWLLSDSATTARPPGSGTPVRQLASSPSPDSDDGEGSVPEPPDSEEPDVSSDPIQDFC